jgi:uncharacterized protein
MHCAPAMPKRPNRPPLPRSDPPRATVRFPGPPDRHARSVPAIPPQSGNPDERHREPAGHTRVVRITIWVRPGSARPGVGGEHDGALIVRIGAPAVDGKATAAALAAVAEAFGVRPHAVTLVAGARSRRKIVDLAGADQAALDRLLAL